VGDVDALGQLLLVARDSGAAVVSVWPKRKTLEDLFLDEVGRGAGHEVLR
jgi:hypothetical protein